MKLLIVAGGGGHFSPALALLEKIPKNWEVTVVGRKYTFEKDKTVSFEYQASENMGIRFIPITTGRLQRSISSESIKSLVKMPMGFWQAYKLLKNVQPDVVLSFGGYVSVPVGLAAWLLQIPLVLHEQTLGAGLANRLLAPFSSKTCISFESSRIYFPKDKIILTGNLLREEFIYPGNMSTKLGKPLPVIYVTGGSSGAHGINLLIEGCIKKLLEKYIVIHQTGEARSFMDYDRLSKTRDGFGPDKRKRYILTKYISPGKVIQFLNQADLVVSRSGMNTVMELLYLGKPSLLIPLPYGQKNEQLHNALFLKNIGIAEVASQNDLSPKKLSDLIDKMILNIHTYKNNSFKGSAYINIHAADELMEVLNNVRKKTD